MTTPFGSESDAPAAASSSVADAPPQASSRWPRAGRLAALAVPLLVLAGAVGYFADASHKNRQAAAAWERRAVETERLLTARTRQLNARSAALNRTADELERSQRDVDKLEVRQKKLANEKAQVEDERGAIAVQASQLQALADEQRTCSDGLAELLSRFANEDYIWVTVNADVVLADCQAASDNFDAFESQYGSE